MSALTLENLQEIVSIHNTPQLTLAIAQFRRKATTLPELTALATAYGTLVFYFDRVRVLNGSADDCDYGDTTPEGLYEYIKDRATAATSALATAEAAEDYSEPTKGEQAKQLRWYEGSGSGI